MASESAEQRDRFALPQMLEPDRPCIRNWRFGNPLVFSLFSRAGSDVFWIKALKTGDVPKSRIIAIGSTGAIGERPTSIAKYRASKRALRGDAGRAT
jgi:hypothetical protein